MKTIEPMAGEDGTVLEAHCAFLEVLLRAGSTGQKHILNPGCNVNARHYTAGFAVPYSPLFFATVIGWV